MISNELSQPRVIGKPEVDVSMPAQTGLVEASKLSVPFAFRDEEYWRNAVKSIGSDSYGLGVVRYAASWAGLMEARIAEGLALEEIADEASHIADSEGLSGHQYFCAVVLLAATWEHGDSLRRWHNLRHQIGDEGEKANETGKVLNTSVLLMSPRRP